MAGKVEGTANGSSVAEAGAWGRIEVGVFAGAEARGPGFRNIALIRAIPDPRLIDWWIGSIGDNPTGALRTGGFGMAAEGPLLIGLVGGFA